MKLLYWKFIIWFINDKRECININLYELKKFKKASLFLNCHIFQEKDELKVIQNLA